MAVELAVGYVTLTVETSRIPGQIDSAIQAGTRGADSAGKSIGSRMASGIGSALKAGVATAGLAAGAVIGTALSKGFGRLTAIDDAQGKLRGLGHDAAAISQIMGSALASVKGTAFGLGEAATIAASAVAAGITPGEELTKYLSLTADAATIAGASLSDMGSIMNKVTTSGKAYTDDLMMLSDRGIPIFQWLQEEYGVSAQALSKMVKEGKVDSETYRKVISENIGGAALESGSTIRGAWANVQAGLGRVGEAALRPFSDMMKGSMGTATEWADKVAPKVEAVATNVAAGLLDLGRAFKSHGDSIDGTASLYETFGVKARQVYDKLGEFGTRVKESIAAFRAGEDGNRIAAFWQTLTAGVDSASDSFGGFTDEGSSLGGTLSKLGSAAAGVGTALVSLTGDTGIVAAELIRGLGTAMGFLADNAGVATAGLVGYFGIMAAGNVIQSAYQVNRMIVTPAEIASRIAMTFALNAHVAMMRAYLVALGHEVPAQQGAIASRMASVRAWAQETYATQQSASALVRWSATASAAAAASNGLTAAMYRTAAGAAALGARVTSSAGVAVSGLARTMSGAVSMIGGPWGAAIAAAGAGILAYNGHVDRNARIQSALSEATVKGARAQLEFKDAVAAANGELSKTANDAAAKALEARMASIIKVADEGHSTLESFAQGDLFAGLSFGDVASVAGGVGGLNDQISRYFDIGDTYDDVQRAIDQNDTLMKVLRDQKLEASDLGRVVAEGGDQYSKLIAALDSTGDAGSDVTKTIRDLHGELQGIREAAAISTPGVGTVTDAIKTLSGEAATADDRLSAMKRALDALSNKPVELGDAMQSYDKQIRDVIAATESQWDESKGFGAGLVLDDGSVNTTTANGDRLRTMLIELRDESARVATAGGDMGPVWQRNEEVLAGLATATGLSVEQMRALADSVGYVPKDIEILANLKGASGVEGQLTALQVMIDANRDKGFTIDAKLLGSDEVIREVQAAGGKIEEVAGKPGVFEVEAPNAQNVLDVIDQIIARKIPSKTVTINEEYKAATASGEWRAPMVLPGNATGGTIHGPGTGTSDSILGIDRATGVPTSWVSRGEEVIQASSASKWRGLLKMINRDDPALGQLPAFAEGGTVPTGVSRALSKLRSVTGNIYDWGGTGPTNFDCSGLVGWVQQLLMGITSPIERLYTTYSLLDGATASLVRGLGPSGTWFRVGVNQEHMAASLAGQPVEAGGSHGTSRIGTPAVGAQDPQFTSHYYLPNALIEGIGTPGVGLAADEEGWTDEDQLKLEESYLDVEEAKAARTKVYEDEDSTDIEKRRADMRVRQAEKAVVKLEQEKDEKATAVIDDYIPEAPALERRYSDDESELERSELAVEDARVSRNKVYADPESTEADLKAADLDYSDAMNTRDELLNGSVESLSGSIADRFKQFGSDLVSLAVDTVRDQIPFGIGNARWLDIDIPDFENHTPAADSLLGQARARSYSQTEIDGQLPVTTDGDPTALAPYIDIAPLRVSEWLKMLPVKVFDSGGWLEPGQMGVNLSSRPEPIFNSPAQLSEFAGELLPAEPAGSDYSVHIHNPQFSDGQAAVRTATRTQERRIMQHSGRPR